MPDSRPGETLPHVIALIAVLAFVGVVGSTLLASLGRAASLEHDPAIDAVLATRRKQARRDIAV